MSSSPYRLRDSRYRSVAPRHPIRTIFQASWLRYLWLVLHLLLITLSVQTSGVFHAATDILLTLAGEQIHQGKPPCPYEEHGQHCPPGCPNCHCSLTAPAVLPVVLSVQWEHLSIIPILLTFHDATAPPRSVFSEIERPPRRTRFA